MIGLYLAPMEDLTGYVFRNTLSKHFGCVDKYFTPFISPDNRIMKTRSKRELIPSNNQGLNVVPQLLTNDPDLFGVGARLIAEFGYKEVNINFGCPSNTVTAKYKGSGILRSPDTMNRFLDGIFNGTDSVLKSYPDLKISVKTRVGYNDTSDFDEVLGILSQYPFSEIIIHPRLKIDLYGGSPRMDMFDKSCEKLSGNIVYNGDVYTAHDFSSLTERFENISSNSNCRISAIMIGRGAIRNPGIFRQIRTGQAMTVTELYDFLLDLYENYKEDFGDTNAIAKMKEVWTYTCGLIDDDKERSRILKSIIKLKSEAEYKDAILIAKSRITLP